MKATFDNSVSILVKAFLANELEHGDCTACAVGNIVMAACNYRPADQFATAYDPDGYRGFGWSSVFVTLDESEGRRQYFVPSHYKGEAQHQIDSTGYTWEQLAMIEKAFEFADYGNSDEDWMFNGLMAVVDVLAEIHGVNLTAKESAKLLFVKS